MNPQRATKICLLTGWPRLEPGSLNLIVPKDSFDALGRMTPLWAEDGTTVTYPAPFTAIPKMRGPYLYFLASATAGDRNEDVLVRRPTNPISQTIELFAPVNLMESLAVANMGHVMVDVHE
jgi:hypothetical protein